MKRVISIFLFSLVLAVTTGADDGSWNKSFSVQGGSIYSDTDHPDISLEKELLVFDGEKTTAVFLFRNTSHKAFTVENEAPLRKRRGISSNTALFSASPNTSDRIRAAYMHVCLR